MDLITCSIWTAWRSGSQLSSRNLCLNHLSGFINQRSSDTTTLSAPFQLGNGAPAELSFGFAGWCLSKNWKLESNGMKLEFFIVMEPSVSSGFFLLKRRSQIRQSSKCIRQHRFQVYKVLRGSSSRLLTLRFRLRGQALGSKAGG